MLIYCSYPLMGQEYEPDWVKVVNHVAEDLEAVAYRPFLSLGVQTQVWDKLSDENNTKVKNILSVLGIEDYFVPKTLQDVLSLETHQGNSVKLITKELWVLANSKILVVDCDLPSNGDRDMILTVARLAGIPTIGVSNNFLVGPWLNELTNFRVSTKDIPNLLRLVAKDLKEVTDVEG